MTKHDDQVLETVRVDWLAGISGPTIGKKLGLTTSMVSGIVRRLRKKGRLPPASLQTVRLPPQRAVGPTIVSQRTATSGCQWLEGHPLHYRWCGEPRREGSAYCDYHHHRCTMPQRQALPHPPKERSA